MKLLLCVTSLNDIQPYLAEEGLSLIPDNDLPFLHSVKILHHEADVIETGVGLYQTVYKLTKVLMRQKYHLAIKLSFGNAYKAACPVGTVLNVVNEKPGDFGTVADGIWADYYDLNLLNREDAPHVRGGYVNLTNAYMNVFLPFRKVVGVTVGRYADNTRVELHTDKYKADVETIDGLGFVYPCLFERQNFYHLCVVEKNLAGREADFAKAKQELNQTLSGLMALL